MTCESPENYRDVHIIRGRGKATICALVKVLNQFGARYSVLHDSDRPQVMGRKSKKWYGNPTWGVNPNIISSVSEASDPTRVKLVASVPNFEEAYFGESVDEEKPCAALLKL